MAIPLRVHKLDGSTLCNIVAEPCWLLHDLREAITQATGISAPEQRLTLCDVLLEDVMCAEMFLGDAIGTFAETLPDCGVEVLCVLEAQWCVVLPLCAASHPSDVRDKKLFFPDDIHRWGHEEDGISEMLQYLEGRGEFMTHYSVKHIKKKCEEEQQFWGCAMSYEPDDPDTVYEDDPSLCSRTALLEFKTSLLQEPCDPFHLDWGGRLLVLLTPTGRQALRRLIREGAFIWGPLLLGRVVADITDLELLRLIFQDSPQAFTSVFETDDCARHVFSRQFVQAVVQGNGLALEFLTKEHQADHETALLAFQQNPAAFQYASDCLRADRSFVLACVRDAPKTVMRYASADIQADPSICKLALSLDW